MNKSVTDIIKRLAAENSRLKNELNELFNDYRILYYENSELKNKIEAGAEAENEAK